MMPDETSSTRLHVFLCHSSGDKPAVRDLYRKLSLDGFGPWLDEEKLLPGQNWDREIRLAVRESDIVVVCLSKASITRTGYIQKELKFALDVAGEQPEGSIFIIPAKLEECEIPERLNALHWVNLFEPNGYDRLVQALKHRVETQRSIETQQEGLSLETRRDSSPGPSPYKATFKYFKSKQGIVVALIAFVTLVIAYAYWQFHKPQGTDDQVQYTGRVINAITKHPIANAKISIETQGLPQVYYTDTEGVFNLKLPNTVDSAHIRVEAEGYELFDPHITVSLTGIEYLLLNPIPIASPTSTPSPPGKDAQVRSASTPKSKRGGIKAPCSTADRLLGKC